MTEITPTYHVENIDQYNRVEEVDSATFANKKIDEGWKLLGIFPSHSDMKDNFPVIYVMGKVYDHLK